MGDNAGNILVKCFFVLFGNEARPAFDSKNNVYVKLGIGISHDVFAWEDLFTCRPAGALGLSNSALLYTCRPAGARLFIGSWNEGCRIQSMPTTSNLGYYD